MFDKIVGAGGEALSDVKVATHIVTPGVISAGLSIHPLNIIELAADVQYNLWSSYKDMSITLNSAAGSMDVANSASDKSYKNTFTGRVGLQVSPFGWLATRAGIYYDQSPVREGEMSPAMPSMSKLGLTAGLSLRFLRLIHLDLAYGYAAPFGGGRTDFAEYIYNFTQEVKTFGGTYSSEAHTFSVGVRVNF
jgi:long-chain fatty acid transport protein